MLIAYWRLQNSDISLCLNVDCFCLIHKLLLTKFKSFCGRSHLWAYDHADVHCILAPSKMGKFLLFWSLFHLLNWNTVVNKKFQSFCVKNNHKIIITLVLVAWWRHQNKKILFVLILDCFCFLINPWSEADLELLQHPRWSALW